jgi:hypothetical protein
MEGSMQRIVALLVLTTAAVLGVAGSASALFVSHGDAHRPSSKTVTFTVKGAFQGKTVNGKAPSNTVRCYPSGDFFNGMWQGTIKGSQYSINFQTRTGAASSATGANTASLIVNNDQQNGLGADNPTITLSSSKKSGALDAQFTEAGSSANSIQIAGPFKCTAH